MIQKIIPALILIAAITVGAIADVPITGEKQYSYRYVINNFADYSDYLFITSSEIWQYQMPGLVLNGTFGGGYKLDGFILHAIKKTDFDPVALDIFNSADVENKNLSNYLESAMKLTSDLHLPIATSMSEKILLDNITVILSINEINETDFNVSRIKTIFGFENGTTDEEHYIEENEEDLSNMFGDVRLDSLELFS
jgi:hypothetical protein